MSPPLSLVSVKNVSLVAIYPKKLRFLLGSSLQQTSEPPCGALDRFGKTRNKSVSLGSGILTRVEYVS